MGFETDGQINQFSEGKSYTCQAIKVFINDTEKITGESRHIIKYF
jgi:hypothetical protein